MGMLQYTVPALHGSIVTGAVLMALTGHGLVSLFGLPSTIITLNNFVGIFWTPVAYEGSLMEKLDILNGGRIR